MSKNIWIFAEYVASKENVADRASRISNIDTEWELANDAFIKIVRQFGEPTIDLFATRNNAKCRRYCSWLRDPEALYINSFTGDWSIDFWYAFPPFALIPRVLKKIREDRAEGILVVPLWTSQAWYPEYLRLLKGKVLTLKPSNKLLLSPCRKILHPLAGQLTLIAGKLSGKLRD